MSKPYGVISLIKIIFIKLFNKKTSCETVKRILPNEAVYELFKGYNKNVHK